MLVFQLNEMIFAALDAGAAQNFCAGGDCMIAIASPETKESVEKS
jgi:hypothetical protein